MTKIEIPWNRGWVWGENPIQRWCDKHCNNNYEANCYSAGYQKSKIIIYFTDEKDATMFLMFYKNND